MDALKDQILQKLIASVIVEKCKENKALVFQESWCSQERVLRFTTPFFRSLFTVKEAEKGKWGTGDFVMYEVHNEVGSLEVNCVLNFKDASRKQAQTAKTLCEEFLLSPSRAEDRVLKSWNLTSTSGDQNVLFAAFDRLLAEEIPAFEKSVQSSLTVEEDELLEGATVSVTLTKYERNRKARAACLEAHGTKCAVCGIEFAQAYGPEFAGLIEVHHIVPLSMIKAEYVVDPVHDLVPVCPNCHMALHSKKDGVYTVEELKALRNRIRRDG